MNCFDDHPCLVLDERHLGRDHFPEELRLRFGEDLELSLSSQLGEETIVFSRYSEGPVAILPDIFVVDARIDGGIHLGSVKR